MPRLRDIYKKSKICGQCHQDLPLSKFYIKNKIKGTRYYCCKDCSNKHFSTLTSNKENAKLKALQKRRYIDDVLNKLRSVPCYDCKQTFPSYCMDFDHMYDKKFKICQNKYSIPLNRLLKEIKKCFIRCCICHGIKTYKDIHRPYKSRSKKERLIFRYKRRFNKCNDCNKSFDFFNLEFDHIDKMLKKFDISWGAKAAYSKVSILDLKNEIRKCVSLCKVCHRIKTMQRLGKYELT